MSERTVTFKGTPVNLSGPQLKAGDTAPDFAVQNQEGMGNLTLADFADKTVIVSVVPSLDTSVCALQTKTFNEKASKLPDSVAVLTISADLPFAQARFCGAENIDKIQVASDHQHASFGQAYGVLIADGPLARVLARAVFVIGPDRVLKYVEYVPEIASEPDYAATLTAAE